MVFQMWVLFRLFDKSRNNCSDLKNKRNWIISFIFSVNLCLEWKRPWNSLNIYRAYHNVLCDYKHLQQENQRTYLNTLMEFFTATGKLKKFFLTTRDVRCVHYRWHGTSVVLRGVWGVQPPPPKFRSFDKAELNSQFRGKYIHNNLTRIRLSLILWVASWKGLPTSYHPHSGIFFLSKAWRDVSIVTEVWIRAIRIP
jgi:hypothetical protein